MTDKEKLKLKIEEQRQLIHPKNTGEMKAVDTPTPLEQGWLNALKWMDELVDSLPEEPVEQDSELEEAAYNFVMDNFGNPKEPLYKFNQRCFKAGAKWQKVKDQETIELAEDHAMLAGMEKMKEQMMKDAVNGYVIEDIEEGNGDFLLSADYLPASMGLKDQQKVKVIILKDEQL